MRAMIAGLVMLLSAQLTFADSGDGEWVWGTSTGAAGLRSFADVTLTMTVSTPGTTTWHEMDDTSAIISGRGDWTTVDGVTTYGATTVAPTIKVMISLDSNYLLSRSGTAFCVGGIKVFLDADGSDSYASVAEDQIALAPEWNTGFGRLWYFQGGASTIREIEDGGKVKVQAYSSCSGSSLSATAANNHLVIMEVE